MKVVLSSRLVYQDPAGTLRIRFDLGRFTVESELANGHAETLQVCPEAMDRLVAAWPRLRNSTKEALK